MTILSLEGPSYAGKTTAIRLLRRIPEIAGRAIFFGCYVRHLRPTHPIPPARTSSAAEQLAAFETFMSAEADRVTMAAMHPGRLVVLDRSIDTLMAHAYALDRLYDFGVHHQVRQRLEELPHLRPHHTIYLDVPDAILRRRRATSREKSTSAYFLHDPTFLALTRSYFIDKPEPPIAGQITVLSAERPAEHIAQEVRALADNEAR
ncbi:hypothetical protein OG946_19155 [Streptomyces sp. NBC_01808]|uniref:hypothetical protein n=1 Tax=Streptomyces sp. NBC_01808 TaxID=2975947 RepID=UPI002DD85162|nr:hypothetical protein [Streptomyces sp. NBC_01808]WSA39291.1 hypothetical protein OG946_19155 [Streptomyces sp. NBC_01808]